MHRAVLPAVLTLACSAAIATAPGKPAPHPDNPWIDAPGFLEASRAALELRQQRRVTEEDFLRMSREPGTLVLDTRSAEAFGELHLAGSVNLPFSDFTEQALREVIPTRDTRILIYCNNNFAPSPAAMQKKTVTMALNVPTFINLVAYGYDNVYELGPLLDPATTRLEFAGRSAERLSSRGMPLGSADVRKAAHEGPLPGR